MQLFVDNNGQLLPATEPSLHSNNRAHLYGDGVFESIRFMNGKFISLEAHISRMLDGAKAINIRTPSFFSVDFFEKRILEVLNKSGLNKSAKIRISIDRISGGTYLPESNEATFFIEVFPIKDENFVLNDKGLELDIYTDVKKQITPWANFKTKNGLLFIMAALKAKEMQLNDVFITNRQGGILETSNSNIFLVSNNSLYTPSIDQGCLAGVMRMNIINLALENNIKVYECNIMPQNLLVADELFLTNAIRGVQWAGWYRTKQYTNSMSSKLIELLNKKYYYA